MEKIVRPTRVGADYARIDDNGRTEELIVVYRKDVETLSSACHKGNLAKVRIEGGKIVSAEVVIPK